jgi:hypothetical protein
MQRPQQGDRRIKSPRRFITLLKSLLRVCPPHPLSIEILRNDTPLARTTGKFGKLEQNLPVSLIRNVPLFRKIITSEILRTSAVDCARSQTQNEFNYGWSFWYPLGAVHEDG